MSENLINKSFDLTSQEVRSIDGSDNNLEHTKYGATGSTLRNAAPLDYGNGYSTPAGSDRPNPRVISNEIAQQEGIIQSDRGLTNFIWAFGQFVDHDVVLSGDNAEVPINIEVPQGDPFLDPQGNGNVVIPLEDTVFLAGTGTDPSNPRQLPNNITAWLDGSNIYGSDATRTNFLRSFSGGLLKVSEGNLLPFGDASIPNGNPSRQDPSKLFVGGDVRTNENSVLISMHTLFVREHNRLATELAQAHPYWTDEQIYQRAREINIAQYQSIVYNEYLPSLLGVDALAEYSGYDSNVNPNISRSFASAAFRVGHTQISSEILRLDPNGEELAAGNLTLSDVFFRPTSVVAETGIDPILRGISASLSQKVDTKLIGDLRNLLFTFGSHTIGRDLFSINVERGRINALADYNTTREAYGLDRVTGFADITSNTELQVQLASLYGNVDNIDLYVGLLAEDHVAGAAVGETFRAIIAEQFAALRDGDRFYYENSFSDAEISEIKTATLSEILRRNTDTTIVQDNAFSLLNQGGNDNNRLSGGLGSDTIYGGGGDDTIQGFQNADLLFGEAGNDLILGHSGKDTLDGGWGNDGYQVDPDASGGSEIYDADGSDFLLIAKSNTIYIEALENLSLTGEDPNLQAVVSESLPTLELTGLTAGKIGIAKSGTNLIIDLDRDGIARAEHDLTIHDFFNEAGKAGSGAIELINNLHGDEIIDYFAKNEPHNPIHRFFDSGNGAHFYTASNVEKDYVINNLHNYTYEGTSFQSAPTPESGSDSLTDSKAVYRFLNQGTGGHLYTMSEVERNYIIDNLSNYSFENIAYYAYETQQENTTALYRFYDSQNDFHFFTPSSVERDYVLEHLPNYQLEANDGIAFYVQPLDAAGV